MNKSQAKKEENFSESLTEFSKAIRDKLQYEIQAATNSLRKTSKTSKSKKDFGTTFKEFSKALKAKTIVEIDKVTEKIRAGIEEEEKGKIKN
jgi:hypothetical protein